MPIPFNLNPSTEQRLDRLETRLNALENNFNNRLENQSNILKKEFTDIKQNLEDKIRSLEDIIKSYNPYGESGYNEGFSRRMVSNLANKRPFQTGSQHEYVGFPGGPGNVMNSDSDGNLVGGNKKLNYKKKGKGKRKTKKKRSH